MSDSESPSIVPLAASAVAVVGITVAGALIGRRFGRTAIGAASGFAVSLPVANWLGSNLTDMLSDKVNPTVDPTPAAIDKVTRAEIEAKESAERDLNKLRADSIADNAARESAEVLAKQASEREAAESEERESLVRTARFNRDRFLRMLGNRPSVNYVEIDDSYVGSAFLTQYKPKN